VYGIQRLREQFSQGAFLQRGLALGLDSLFEGTILNTSWPLTCLNSDAKGNTPADVISARLIRTLRSVAMRSYADSLIDEGVSRAPAAGFVPSLEPARDLFGHPSLGKPVADKPTKIWISLEDGVMPPAQLIGPLGVKLRMPA
jgi:hypothetical protein